MNRDNNVKRNEHPKDTVNLLSRFSFFYTLNLFIKSFNNGLSTDDLYDVIKSCKSEDLGAQLEKQFTVEEKTREKPSISRALMVCHWKHWAIVGILQLLTKLFTTCIHPYALSKVVAYFSVGQTTLSKNDVVFYASTVIGLYIFNIFFERNVWLSFEELGIKIKVAVGSLLYRKALKLNGDSLSNTTMGRIITIINKDTDAMDIFMTYFNLVWIGIIQVGLICYLIYARIGIASVPGIACFFIILPLQIFLGLLAYKFHLENSYQTDSRLELLQEILSGIKLIKMYTWESFFEKRVSTIRKKELYILHKYFYSKIAIQVIGGIGWEMAFFLFIATYNYMGGVITAETVYYILGLFSNLEETLNVVIPFGLSLGAEVFAVIERIETILLAKEVTFSKSHKEIRKNKGICLEDLTVKIKDVTILENISLNIFDSGLYLIAGYIGSGKSTFLKSLLQECDTTGSININGSVSYASQEPWIFPSTIKNNIIFGEKFDKHRYQKILKICNLEYDLKIFLDGDMTIVGNCGISLSKGQQVRINLARAIYKEADIYLIDDSLASLDGPVSDCIFQNCIRNFLKNKICILVTNNVNYIKQNQNIIIIKNKTVTIEENTQKNLKQVDEKCEKSNFIENNKVVAKNVYHEHKKTGKVTWKHYYKYIRHGGGVVILSLIMVFFLSSQAAISYSDKLVSQWVTLKENLLKYNETNMTTTLERQDINNQSYHLFSIYIGVTAAVIILAIIEPLAFFNFVRLGSLHFHKNMVHGILKAPMTFFDNNLLGNILNRFSKDFICTTFGVFGSAMLLTSINSLYLIECLAYLSCAAVVAKFYLSTGRDLQRCECITKSPIMGHLNSTLDGLITIRSSDAQEILIEEFDKHQDLYTSANYTLLTFRHALSISLELFSTLLISLIMFQFIFLNFDVDVGDVGLAITHVFKITSIISHAFKTLISVDNQMTCVERILEFTKLQKDETDNKQTNIEDWSKLSSISFKNVSLSCTNTSILKSINFEINNNEKLGILGRTGAGKSSLISCLFKFYEISGKIYLGHSDIDNISLDQLRSKISIIPQNPFVFCGTIRENLDPLQQYSDVNIWKIIKKLNLDSIITDLNQKLDKNANLSVGQKQLLCIGRAILRKNKIVVLDEITASFDQETDDIINKVIDKNFEDCTMMIIAHKLSSVKKCNKILVLSEGEVVEYDTPEMLLKNSNSLLHSLI